MFTFLGLELYHNMLSNGKTFMFFQPGQLDESKK
ncbi:hypothetical protein Pla110_42760 [Polystyrenella longa]|uniref:Uncharacterized protein n=1 Tax=Polystyrenella longa TaxID=2528007 RepID=A0A518CTH0_9PLAN|nr:hypothetical protein Pla110_42760 [Polystyrenella longa]